VSHCGEVVDVDDLDIENMSADKKESITRTYEESMAKMALLMAKLKPVTM
jgi:hypothetical protein